MYIHLWLKPRCLILCVQVMYLIVLWLFLFIELKWGIREMCHPLWILSGHE